MKKIMVVFGTRPEGIKLAPVIKEIQKEEKFELLVVSTGQHKEMLKQVTDIFKIKVNIDLNIMESVQNLTDITSRTLERLSRVISDYQPDLTIVHGDTTTSFAAALASFYHQIPVGHVEAGLRTYEKFSPFPEEINRQMTARIADIHFVPTNQAKKNLMEERISQQNIVVTGNTSIDAVHYILKIDQHSTAIKEFVRKIKKPFVLMTVHRRENIPHLQDIFSAINDIALKRHLPIIYPVHLNPLVKQKAETIFADNPYVHLMDPLDIADFLYMTKNASYIITDSGGIQEEAPSLNVPVFVVRDTTERVEGEQAGTLILIGTEYEKIYHALDEVSENSVILRKMSENQNPYGDGNAAEKIVVTLKNYFSKRD